MSILLEIEREACIGWRCSFEQSNWRCEDGCALGASAFDRAGLGILSMSQIPAPSAGALLARYADFHSANRRGISFIQRATAYDVPYGTGVAPEVTDEANVFFALRFYSGPLVSFYFPLLL